jgi:hypothetical protein
MFRKPTTKKGILARICWKSIPDLEPPSDLSDLSDLMDLSDPDLTAMLRPHRRLPLLLRGKIIWLVKGTVTRDCVGWYHYSRSERERALGLL